MLQKPELTNQLDSATFRRFYYLREELESFCKAYGLPISGNKIDLTERIAHYLDTGEILPTKKSASKKYIVMEKPNLCAVIPPNFVCSEEARAFFKEIIGPSFKFNVRFQAWLKSNPGKTYAAAVNAYYEILEEKKHTKSSIGKQFEYNAYIRDFFADNKGKSLQDAIRCWNYKKTLEGIHKYESSDLIALSTSS